jgi:hypothetical protein
MMNALQVSWTACPWCKDALDALQAAGMAYSIYFMFALVYGLAGLIAWKVYRTIQKEEEMEKRRSLPAIQAGSPAGEKLVLTHEVAGTPGAVSRQVDLS